MKTETQRAIKETQKKWKEKKTFGEGRTTPMPMRNDILSKTM